MTPERAKALLPVIAAFAAGKSVQVLTPSTVDGKPNRWADAPHNCGFDLDPSRYRIKPEVVQVHPHRRYLWRALDGDIKMAIHQQSNSLKPEHIEGHSYFVKWLDTAWVETSHECEAA